MNSLQPFESPPENRWLDRLQAATEVMLLSGLVSGFFAAIPFSYAIGRSASWAHLEIRVVIGSLLLEAWISFVLLWIILRAHREGLYDLGLRSEHWRSNVVVGLALVPALFLTNALITEGFRVFLPKYYLDRNPLTEIIRTPGELILFIFSAWVAGGIKEELQRAFILTRFRHHLGGSGVGLVLWSLAFGAGHYVQGIQGIAAATLFGFIFGTVYLVRGSLIAPIVAHGVYDTVALLGYWFYKG